MTAKPSTLAETPVRLYLLGPFRLEQESQALRLPKGKVESLLAYLVLYPEEHRREKLAALFWGGLPDVQARHSLRTALNLLRKTLGTESLLADRAFIQLNPAFSYWVDALEFRAQATRFLDGAASSVDFELYQDDLLPEFYDDWFVPERETYRQLYLDALLRMTELMRAQSEYTLAIEFAAKALKTDPANERAHQHLMFCHVQTGNRAEALRQFEKCQHSLQMELAVEPMPETVALYHWVRQAPSEHKPPEALVTNLPIPLSSFVGRKWETIKVKELFARARLLTLTGAGGCGKTRLAIHVATDLMDGFRDGVWWVELAPLMDYALVPNAAAKALGVREVPHQSLVDTLTTFLREKKVLLVLDNCEHLIAACARLAMELLERCPNLKILTTSREPLGITGEVVWSVPSLSLPDPQWAPLERLSHFESIQLFVQRVTTVHPTFALTEHNAAVVAQVCRRLDGIPLALELAAARMKVLSLEQLEMRLHDRFTVLTIGGRAAMPRQQTLRATMDWSYDLLSPKEQVLFRRLAVFAGGFTLEAVEGICGFDGIAQPEMLDLFSRLVDKSLVQIEPSDDQSRFRLLESIREYARAKLLESAENSWVRSRHLGYFLNLAEEGEPHLKGGSQRVWMNRLRVEQDNLRTALTWALTGNEPAKDANQSWAARELQEAGLRLAGALGWFWYRSGDLSEGIESLKQMLNASGGVSTSARVKVLVRAGVLANAWGDYEQSIQFSESSLSLSRQMGDTYGIAASLQNTAVIAHHRGEHARAFRLLETSRTLYNQVGDKWGVASAMLWLADTLVRQGKIARAAALWAESLARFRELGDLWGIAFALGGSGNTARLQGDVALASQLLKENLILHRSVGDTLDLPYGLETLAIVATQLGEPARAARLWGAAAALREAHSIPLPPSYQTDYAPAMSQARAEMGAVPFSAGWEEGRAMTLDQAIEYALQVE